MKAVWELNIVKRGASGGRYGKEVPKKKLILREKCER
jgi:hypothetical protein